MSTTTTAFEMDGLKTRLKETSKRTCTQRCVPSRRPLAELLPICRLLGRQSVKGRVSFGGVHQEPNVNDYFALVSIGRLSADVIKRLIS
jgi:hypothetical protein